MNKFMFAMFLGTGLMIAACDSKDDRILPKMDPAAQAHLPEASAREKEAFGKQARKELDELGVKISGLRKKALTASGQAREKLDREISEFEQEKKNIEERLVQLKAEMSEKWKDMKEGVNQSISRLRQAIQNAI